MNAAAVIPKRQNPSRWPSLVYSCRRREIKRERPWINTASLSTIPLLIAAASYSSSSATGYPSLAFCSSFWRNSPQVASNSGPSQFKKQGTRSSLASTKGSASAKHRCGLVAGVGGVNKSSVGRVTSTGTISPTARWIRSTSPPLTARKVVFCHSQPGTPKSSKMFAVIFGHLEKT